MKILFYFVLFIPFFLGMSKQAKFDKICEVFEQESDECIINKFEKVENLNCEIEGFTPLIWAIWFERVIIVNYLISIRHVDVNMSCGCWKETPLHYAVFTGNKNICEKLFKAGAHFVEDYWGNTPEAYLKAFNILRNQNAF